MASDILDFILPILDGFVLFNTLLSHLHPVPFAELSCLPSQPCRLPAHVLVSRPYLGHAGIALIAPSQEALD